MFLKIKNLNYLLIFLILLISLIGVAGLYSAAGGSYNPWASRHLIRLAVLFVLLLLISYRYKINIQVCLFSCFIIFNVIGFGRADWRFWKRSTQMD